MKINKLIAILLLLASFYFPITAQVDRIESKGDFDSTSLSSNAFDTVNTNDKFLKIILFEDYTWKYHDIGKPFIDDSILNLSWNNEDVHAFKDVEIKNFPDEINLLLVDSTHHFHKPVNGRKVYSRFSSRGSREHRGADIPLSIGDSIWATFDGKVRVLMKSRQTGGYGNLVVLRHANGLETYYGHLSKVFVKENELVKAGELIALGGNSGRSTGPHLHFEARYQGKPFDPERIIDFENETLRDTLITLKKHYFNIYSHYGQTDEQSIQASQRQYYTIKSGDTLSRISSIFGTSVDKLCKWNGLSRNTTLKIGRKIIVRY